MKKFIYFLYYYSEVIVYYSFWIYFGILMVFYFILGITIPVVLSYLFFFLLGMYLGVKLLRKAFDFLRGHKDEKNV